MDTWLRQSANEIYTYEDNQAYLLTLHESSFEYQDDGYLFVIANTKLEGDTHYLRSIHCNQAVENYLLGYFPQPTVNEAMDIIYDFEKEGGLFVYDLQTYRIDKHTGFITTNAFKINYYYDLIQPQEIPNIIHLSTIQDAKQRLECFFGKSNKIIRIEICLGDGENTTLFKTGCRIMYFSTDIIDCQCEFFKSNNDDTTERLHLITI
jgi:hypothetical protein